jgi:hypothetical protein
MIFEFLRALLLAGLPVGLASYLLFAWTLRHRRLGAITRLREAEREIKRQSKEEAKQRKQLDSAGSVRKLAEGASLTPHMLAGSAQTKWLTFGGGFYGIVGLLTYAAVEVREIWDFLSSFENLTELLANLGLNTLIGLLVDALVNFVVAIAWPVYWLSSIQSDHIWAWFVAAYAGYWAGAQLALKRAAAVPTDPP